MQLLASDKNVVVGSACYVHAIGQLCVPDPHILLAHRPISAPVGIPSPKGVSELPVYPQPYINSALPHCNTIDYVREYTTLGLKYLLILSPPISLLCALTDTPNIIIWRWYWFPKVWLCNHLRLTLWKRSHAWVDCMCRADTGLSYHCATVRWDWCYQDLFSPGVALYPPLHIGNEWIFYGQWVQLCWPPFP